MSERLRVALIGCGGIANFHVPALREAAFDVTAVAGRPNSERVDTFARNHGIRKVFRDPIELAARGPKEWDALVIAAPPGESFELMKTAAQSNCPVLVEKPVTTAARELRAVMTAFPKVLVGYNRRFYSTVGSARRFAAGGGPCVVQLELPERVLPGADGPDTREIFNNSVHGFDLLRHLFGDLHVVTVLSSGNGPSRNGSAAMLRSARGDVVHYIGNWNAPANFSLTIDRGAQRLRLQPFEVGAKFEGMEVIEPTPAVPIRQYRPICTERVELDQVDQRFKPGFVGQALELRRLCDGAGRTIGASLEDAVLALELAETVSGCGFSRQS